MFDPMAIGTRDPNSGWSSDRSSGHRPPTGTGPHFHPPADVVGDMPATGFSILSSNGSRWQVTVDNTGTLVVTAL